MPSIVAFPHSISRLNTRPAPAVFAAILLALSTALPSAAQPVPAPEMPTQSVAELEALRRASSIDRASIAQLKAELEAARLKLDARAHEISELQKDLELSRAGTAAALAAQSAAAESLPDAQAAKLEIETLRGQVRTLEAQIEEDRKHAAEEIAALAAQLAKTKDTAKALTEANRSLSDARGSDESTVRATVENLQQKAAELTTALEKMRTERDEQRAHTIESDKGLETQAASIAELTQLNEKLTADKKALEQQVAKLRPALERATADATEIRGRLASDETQAQKQAEQLDALTKENEKLSADLKKATTDLDAARAESARLAPAATAQPALQKERDEALARVAEADKALDNQAGTVAELTQLNEQLKADKATLQQQLAAQSAQATTLTGDLAAAQREAGTLRAEAARAATLDKENAALAARLRQAQATLDQIATNARILASNQSGAIAPGTYAPSRPGTITVPQQTAPAPAAAPAPAQPPARYHTVTDGDSLSKISLIYYGSPNRWQEIYDANRAVLRGENSLRPGQRLRIP